ncbi:hypothetical protein L1049_003887 [Liquidambar formosana]|uniref:Uncharacterized protein n=1 Tax=Liquidambar formosana TaxID=63359 RepID=A0AAP0RSX5_LIQFO
MLEESNPIVHSIFLPLLLFFFSYFSIHLYTNQLTFLMNKFKFIECEFHRESEKNKSLEEKIIELQKDLVKTNETLKDMTCGSEKLGVMLCIGKFPKDKHGLGFVSDHAIPSSSSSKDVPTKSDVSLCLFIYLIFKFLVALLVEEFPNVAIVVSKDTFNLGI